jgi:hypothetical protein
VDTGKLRSDTFKQVQRPYAGRSEHPKLFEVVEKELTEADKDEGIVYILRHINNERYLKLSWTREQTVEERINQPRKNCYRFNTELAFSSEEHFSGAYRVKRLVQAEMRQKNIKIFQCKYCQ